MTWINIPEDWTGNQAIAVVEFLDELSAAIWSTHELKMLDACHSDIALNAETDDEMPPDAVYVDTKNPSSLDDDFPF